MTEDQIELIYHMLEQVLMNQFAILRDMYTSKDDEFYPRILETGVILKTLEAERADSK